MAKEIINASLEVIDKNDNMKKHLDYKAYKKDIKSLVSFLNDIDKATISSIYLSHNEDNRVILDIVKNDSDIISLLIYPNKEYSYKYTMVALYYYDNFNQYRYHIITLKNSIKGI